MQHLLERLNQVGFERTRRAIAALGLSLFLFFYLLVALNAPPGLGTALGALAACYGVAFMAVTAEWFWGRWFAMGLGWSGVMMAIVALTQLGWTPVLAIFGGIHGLVVLVLMGPKMAERFDLQPAWRERYGMDEFGVARLRKTVTRASASLPSVIFYLLAPKPDGQAVFAASTFAAGLLALAGLVGVIRLRAWGLLAIAGSIVAFTAAGVVGYPHFDFAAFVSNGASMSSPAVTWAYRNVVAGPALPILLLSAALAPFARPAARFLKNRA